ncbi:MAG: hypothetical protein ACK53L_21750, partial [Pirellulaceae bacterium]
MSTPPSPPSVGALTYRIRPAVVGDLKAIQQLLQPYVEARKLLKRTRQELLNLMENGFVAEVPAGEGDSQLVGFSAVEIYSRK